ncbi:MAG: hypothetical protein RL235_63 [Chlamydiota bacterium]|jgi:D-sedoheptulose 7-phosphate isomerase
MFQQRFGELEAAVCACEYTVHQETVSEEAMYGRVRDLLTQSGSIYVIGNGGSAGIASHFSNDLMKALKIPSHTLYDSNLLTCLANDYGYAEVFSYPLDILLKPGDVLVAISSSGKSTNIVKAAQIAKDRGASVIALTGFSHDNPLRKLGSLSFWIDRSDYGIVETAHFFLLHTIVDVMQRDARRTREYAEHTV